MLEEEESPTVNGKAQEECLTVNGKVYEETETKKGLCGLLSEPGDWFRMIAKDTHWSFVFGVVVYGISQGLGGGIGKVASDYYWKDVQKVEPSESQIYSRITSVPWMVKPLWGLLTDVIPIFGYRRRPYFIIAGILGVISMLLGFSISGFLVHLIGPKGVFGVLCIPASLVFLVGMVLDEPHIHSFSYTQEIYPHLLNSGKY